MPAYLWRSSQALIPGRSACFTESVQRRPSVILLTPELIDVPEWSRLWFAVAGKVPTKGTALLVTFARGWRDVAYSGVFIELLSPQKLRTGPGESKAMQPVNLTIALLLTDEQHSHFVNQHTLPRVSQLEMPGGASTPLWDALQHMPKERHVALGAGGHCACLWAPGVLQVAHWVGLLVCQTVVQMKFMLQKKVSQRSS